MSTKKTTRPRTTRQELPALSGGAAEDFLEPQPKLRRLRAIQQQYAATIIAAGVFNSTDEIWTEVIASLVNNDAEKALNGLFDRLERATPGSTRIALPTPGFPDHEDDAENVLTWHGCSWGDAGFLLGLAVGMQLGPHAFDGGAK